jgi:putative addiction module killer protein
MGVARTQKWFYGLHAQAAAKVATAVTQWHKVIYRIQRALAPGFTNTASILGHRSYFGKDGDRLVILLAGGTKKRQQDDIRHAQELWTDYRRRSKKEK